METVERPSGWERLGPYGRFLVGFVVFVFLSFVAVGAFEHILALTVRVPTVDTLPDRVSVCGRSYHRAAGASQDLLTLVEIRGTGIEPVVVLPLRIQPCTPDACNGCTTVVFVRVEGDRYAAYDLLGGP